MSTLASRRLADAHRGARTTGHCEAYVNEDFRARAGRVRTVPAWGSWDSVKTNLFAKPHLPNFGPISDNAHPIRCALVEIKTIARSAAIDQIHIKFVGGLPKRLLLELCAQTPTSFK